MDTTDFQKISLLYVEDDEDIRSELIDFLEVYFGKLYVAKDGFEGLNLFKEHTPDIIISDIQMPTMDGLTMCEEIRKIDTNVPIIITTAFNEPSFLVRSIDIGIDKYVTKPINLNKLESSLLRCSEFVLQKRKIDCLLSLSCELMDQHDNLMYITGDNFKHINQSLLNFLGFNTVEEFFKNHQSIFEKLQTVSNDEIIITKNEWLEFIKNNPNKEHIIYLKNCMVEDSSNKIIPYKINVKYFDEIEHYLIIFDALGDEKL